MSLATINERKDPKDHDGWVAHFTHGGDAMALRGRIKHGAGTRDVQVVVEQEFIERLTAVRTACSAAARQLGHAVWHMDHNKLEPCSGETRMGRLPTLPVDEDLDKSFYAWASGPGAPAMTTPELREAFMACWQAARWALIKSLGDLTLKELDALRAEAGRHP